MEEKTLDIKQIYDSLNTSDIKKLAEWINDDGLFDYDDISMSDFYDNLTSSEKYELVEWLEMDDYIECDCDNSPTSMGMGLMYEDFAEALENLHKNYTSLSTSIIEQIITLGKQ